MEEIQLLGNGLFQRMGLSWVFWMYCICIFYLCVCVCASRNVLGGKNPTSDSSIIIYQNVARRMYWARWALKPADIYSSCVLALINLLRSAKHICSSPDGAASSLNSIPHYYTEFYLFIYLFCIDAKRVEVQTNASAEVCWVLHRQVIKSGHR